MDVFVYGTLTDPEQIARVVSEFEFRGPAVLEGLHRVDGEYPTLAPGGTVPGRVLRTPEVEALDAYEGVATGLYVRVSVPLVRGESGDDFAGESNANGDESNADTGEREVDVYVGDPDALGADVEWPAAEPFPAAVERFCRGNEVVVQPRP
ncbi:MULTISPECIES: gamma-glutamylcyclotransferase [Halorussus]|uniref:gamma-glutamylcyclotransferase family protein n=1 Tax=Halorussus TaxID=1070314 RepID=UPI000E20E1D8|nr:MULTISPECIES: gamma-glutamylcyclotransferase family protein [Halorussus]NHN60907.1 gamma-glutamylcyclotransferase [Halorussus sp. JP-T4]